MEEKTVQQTTDTKSQPFTDMVETVVQLSATIAIMGLIYYLVGA